jgi:hypothetical protein
LHFQNVGELRPLQADLLGSGWGVAGQAMRAAAAGERAEVLLRSFRRSLAGFGGQRLGTRSMRAIAVRSGELCWLAITGVGIVCWIVGGSHITPPAKIVVQVLKRAGKCMWRPERVVFVEGCCGVAGGGMAGVGLVGKGRGGMAGCAAAGVIVAGRVKLIPPLASFRICAGLTLSDDTVTGLPRTRSCRVLSLLDRTW